MKLTPRWTREYVPSATVPAAPLTRGTPLPQELRRRRAQHGVNFVPPRTLEEAETRRLELVKAIQQIEAQLGNRNALGPDGVRLSEHEYWEWHNRAVRAKQNIVAELTDLKLWTRNINRQRAAKLAKVTPSDVNDPVALLFAAYGVFQRLRYTRREDLPMEEFQRLDHTMDLVNHFLSKRVPVTDAENANNGQGPVGA